jgi:hypothetical protein
LRFTPDTCSDDMIRPVALQYAINLADAQPGKYYRPVPAPGSPSGLVPARGSERITVARAVADRAAISRLKSMHATPLRLRIASGIGTSPPPFVRVNLVKVLWLMKPVGIYRGRHHRNRLCTVPPRPTPGTCNCTRRRRLRHKPPSSCTRRCGPLVFSAAK